MTRPGIEPRSPGSLANTLLTGPTHKHTHLGMRGNERADSAAKSATDLTPYNLTIPYTELKSKINKLLLAKWQQRWNNNIHNKFFQIQPTLEVWKPAFRKSRREQVIISWLHIDNRSLTHSFILKHIKHGGCCNHRVWYVKRLAPLNTFSQNVVLSSESDFSRWIVWPICLRKSKWKTVSPFWERNRIVPKYDKLKSFNALQTNDILLI